MRLDSFRSLKGSVASPTPAARWYTRAYAHRRLPLPNDVILQSGRWYLRFSSSYRDLEETLSERGVFVDLAYGCVVALRYRLTQRVPSKHSPAGHSQMLTS